MCAVFDYFSLTVPFAGFHSLISSLSVKLDQLSAMGRFTDKTESKGFLKDLFQKLQSNLNAEQVKNFANLDDDEARYKFVVQDPNLKEFTVSRNESIKNLKLSLDFKQKGNGEFQSQNWKSALDFYNKGLLLVPAEHGE